MKNIQKLMLLIGILFIGISVSAQYTGPGHIGKYYTVKEVKSNGMKLDRNDALVQVEGYIVNQVNNDIYQFKDASGVINVAIKKKVMPETPFNDSTLLVLIGEVDYDFIEGIEIEVDQIIVKDKPTAKN